MASMSGYQQLIDQLRAYKKKFYLNQLLKGSIWTALFLIVAYLLFSSLEYSLRFSSPVRAILFFAFIGLMFWMFIQYIFLPILRLADNRRQLSSEDAAHQIGLYFPEVGDKLLNTLQLSSVSAEDNALIQASIDQRSQELGIFTFTDAISYSSNQKYAKYLAIPLVLALLAWIFYPQLLRDGSERIINYQQEYIPVAPFQFHVENSSLTAFRNEDFTISLSLAGTAIPDAVYLQTNGRRLKMSKNGAASFEYTFSKIQQAVAFKFEAAGYNSQSYAVQVVNRPNLKNFNVRLSYPAYLAKPADRLSNIGNLEVPQGTQISWQFNTLDADSLRLNFVNTEEVVTLQLSDNQVFEYEDRFLNSEDYNVTLYNEYSANRDEISYTIQVIPDEYPTISLDQLQDTTLYKYVILGGNIADDHGLTELRLRYRLTAADEEPVEKFESVSLDMNTTQLSQSYYHRWLVDTFNLQEGDRLEYYLQVLDNDGVNGRKSTRSAQFTFALPSRSEIQENLDRVAQQTENELDNTLERAQQLRERLQETEERLQGKNELDWRDQNQLEKLLEEREALEQAIQEMQNQLQENNAQQQAFQEPNEALQQKMESLQELISDVLDPETKQLWDELQRLLQEQGEKEQVQELVENLNQSEKNLEEELDRALELFKRMQAEIKLEESIQDLQSLIDDQQELLEDTATEPEDSGNNEADSEQNQDESGEESGENGDSEQNDGESSENEQSEGNQESEEGNDPENSDGKDSENQENTDSEQNAGENGENQEPKSDQELAEEQERLREEFEDVKEKLDEFREKNQELDRPTPLSDTWDEEQSIEQEQQESQESLENGERQQSQQSQQNATQQMQQMQQKLQQMQSSGSAGMQQNQENLDNLRDIVDNLVKLSFNQEALMKEFRAIQLRDPRIIDLSQDQLKLADDAQVIEDSLLALANRVFQIQSFVTRELNSMNDHMDKTVEFLRDRTFNQAMSEQQFAMTSMNNLAMLLDDVLNQMQQQMAQAMGMGSGQGQNQSPSDMNLGQMQQQLNQQIEQLQRSGKSGRELSEELARMAAEQERLRKALQQMEQMMRQQPGAEPGGNLSEIMQQMEQSEIDLVNKRLTQELIERQKQIATRLLEAEKALREQEMEQEREAQQAGNYERIIPEAFEEYIRQKEREIELLKSVPLQLNPYYKKEVSDYFKRLNDN